MKEYYPCSDCDYGSIENCKECIEFKKWRDSHNEEEMSSILREYFKEMYEC